MISHGFMLTLVISITLTLISGCAGFRTTAVVSPDADVGKMKTFYVVQHPRDGRGVGILIKDNLVRRGFEATAGDERPQGSYQSDAVVTYVDRWTWDLTMIMVDLTITFRNPTNQSVIATANTRHPPLPRVSSQEMVEEVVSNIFNSAKGKK